MKKWMSWLLALMLLWTAAGAFAETAAAPDLYDLYEETENGLQWVCTAVPMVDGVAMISPAGLPEEIGHVSAGAGTVVEMKQDIAFGDLHLIEIVGCFQRKNPGFRIKENAHRKTHSFRIDIGGIAGAIIAEKRGFSYAEIALFHVKIRRRGRKRRLPAQGSRCSRYRAIFRVARV